MGLMLGEKQERRRGDQEREPLADSHLVDSDTAYPLRINLPSSSTGNNEKGTRDVLTKHKHDKVRRRRLVQLGH